MLRVLIGVWATAFLSTTTWAEDRQTVHVHVNIDPLPRDFISHLFLMAYPPGISERSTPSEVLAVDFWITEWPKELTMELRPGFQYIAMASTLNRPSPNDLSSEILLLTEENDSLFFSISVPTDSEFPAPHPIEYGEILIDTGRSPKVNERFYLLGYPQNPSSNIAVPPDRAPMQLDLLEPVIDGRLVSTRAKLNDGWHYIVAMGASPAIEDSVHTSEQIYNGQETFIFRFESPPVEIADINAPISTIEDNRLDAQHNPKSSEMFIFLAIGSLCGVGVWIMRIRKRRF